MTVEEKNKGDILEKIKRIIPGTEQIEHCKILETCMDKNYYVSLVEANMGFLEDYHSYLMQGMA